MGKNQSPKQQMGRTPSGKPTPQSMKKGGSHPGKRTPGHFQNTPKQPFQAGKGGQTPGKSPGKNFPTPKQSLNFQTPKQTPKGQQTPQNKKPQPSGKKTTPHPLKSKQVEEESDDDDEFDDEDMSGDDSMEDESDESMEANKSKPANGAMKKQLQQQASAKKGQQLSTKQSKAPASDDDEDEEDDEDDFDDEDDSLEDESDGEEGLVAQKLPAGKAKAQMAKGQNLGSQMKRSAPQEESDDEDEEEEDDDDDDDEEEDEESEEEESEDEETHVKGSKKHAQQQKAGAKANSQPQKKMKTNAGNAVAIEKKERQRMPTKLDKKLQDDVEDRKRERDRRSLFVKNLPKGTADEEIKALSPDIVHVNRLGKSSRFGYLVFANDKVCQKNYEKLKNAKLGKDDLYIDFCGEFSKAAPPKQNTSDIRVDALRLYIGGLPPKTTEDQLKPLFPSASSFHHRAERNYAFVGFDTPEKARQAFDSNKQMKINGFNVVVSFAKIYDNKKKPKTDAVKKFADDQASGKVITRG